MVTIKYIHSTTILQFALCRMSKDVLPIGMLYYFTLAKKLGVNKTIMKWLMSCTGMPKFIFPLCWLQIKSEPSAYLDLPTAFQTIQVHLQEVPTVICAQHISRNMTDISHGLLTIIFVCSLPMVHCLFLYITQNQKNWYFMSKYFKHPANAT